MYNDNPTLVGVKKEIDESRQGQVFFEDEAI